MSRFCISIACDLKENTPENVIDILAHMVGLQRSEFKELPSHDFFEVDEWDTLLSDITLRWFPGEGGASLRRVSRYFRPLTQGGDAVFFHTFSFRCEGNDDGITPYIALLDWLAPYSETDGFIGYCQYEYSQHPSILYFQQGILASAQISDPPANVHWGQ